ERKQGERMLAHKKTLADVAKARLDEMENLVAGKPAPAIDGTGMDGKPLKLSDYRGKVVVLVFWGTWCGPCMQEVPTSASWPGATWVDRSPFSAWTATPTRPPRSK